MLELIEYNKEMVQKYIRISSPLTGPYKQQQEGGNGGNGGGRVKYRRKFNGKGMIIGGGEKVVKGDIHGRGSLINLPSQAPPTTSSSGPSAQVTTTTKRLPGRPVGAKGRKITDANLIKNGLLRMFQLSKAPSVILAMMNYQLPPGYADLYAGKQLTRREMLTIQSKRDSNFKWAIGQCFKLFGRELTVMGKLEGEFTLTGMVKRAITSKKSNKVMTVAQQEELRRLEEYSTNSMEEDGVDG